jgi:hypothetical protein
VDQAAIVLEELTITAATSGQGESITARHAMEKRGSLEGTFRHKGTSPTIESSIELIEVATE